MVEPQRAGSNAPYYRPMSYGALDLGTNNCRLLIARPNDSGFVIIDAFSRVVRLGEGLSASGRLSDAAIERTVEALAICADKLVRRGVNVSRAVATEACRQATNGPAFVARVLRETGIKLEVIDPAEEARLAVSGCHALLEPGDGPALIIDIGGGSTEMICVSGGTGGWEDTPLIERWISVPWGVVSMAESEPEQGYDPATRCAIYARMRARFANAIGAFVGDLRAHNGTSFRLLGTSGTVTTLASLYLGLASYDRDRVDGLYMPAAAVRALSAKLSRLSLNERAALSGIGAERADLVVAGCAILDAILDVWPAPRVGVADRGIREGILRALMASSIR